jgi:hypothetical protein
MNENRLPCGVGTDAFEAHTDFSKGGDVVELRISFIVGLWIGYNKMDSFSEELLK